MIRALSRSVSVSCFDTSITHSRCNPRFDLIYALLVHPRGNPKGITLHLLDTTSYLQDQRMLVRTNRANLAVLAIQNICSMRRRF